MTDRPNPFSHAGQPNVERPLERFLRPTPEQAGFAQHPEAEAIMLDLVLASGDRIGLNYAYMNLAQLTSDGVLTLEFTSARVIITGRGLLTLYNNILTHHAYRIEASATPFDDNSSEVWVKSLVVEEKEERCN